MKTLDKILIIVGVFLALFIITMVIVFCVYQSVPDSLIVGVLGSGGVECIMCALIQVAKKRFNVEDDMADN